MDFVPGEPETLAREGEGVIVVRSLTKILAVRGCASATCWRRRAGGAAARRRPAWPVNGLALAVARAAALIRSASCRSPSARRETARRCAKLAAQLPDARVHQARRTSCW